MSSHFSPRACLVAAAVAALAIGSTIAAERSSSAMSDAATRFLGSLTAEQRQQASFQFDADERLHWHFIPPRCSSKGLLIRSMTEPQRTLARDLLKAGLSQRGFSPRPRSWISKPC
jgi:hypothetical protein